MQGVFKKRVFLQNRVFIVITLLNILIASFILFKINSTESKNSHEIASETVIGDAENLAKDCRGQGQSCYGKALASVVKERNFVYALSVLLISQDINPESRDCHVIAHYLAIAAIHKNPGQWREFLSSIDANLCGGGFIHGAIEGLSRYDSSVTFDALTLSQMCDIAKKSVRVGDLPDAYCGHFIGHILLVEANGDTRQAVKNCKKAPLAVQNSCYAGVFMENILRVNLSAHGLGGRLPINEQTVTDYEKVCQEQDGLIAQSCWLEMPHVYGDFTGNNPEKVYDLCTHSSTEESKIACYNHFLETLGPNAKKTQKLCTPYNSDPQRFNRCMDVVVTSLLMISSKHTEDAIGFCEIQPNDYQKNCYTRIGNMLSNLVSPEEREQLCQGAPQNFKKLCSKT